MNRLVIRSISLLALAGAAFSAQANLLQNGGFESGDFSNWTYTGLGFSTVTTGFASEGIYSAYLGDFSVLGGGSLTQSFASVVGQSYTFSFDFAGDGDTPSGFDAQFDGNSVLTLTNPAFDLDFVHYSYTVTATSTTTDVKFAFYDDPFFMNLDNVSVVANASPTAPSPAAFIPFVVGGISLLRRRRI